MPTQTKTPFCFRCQHWPGPDDAPLKRCGRCRSRHYCSAECQRNDWPEHKQECPALAAGEEAPTRTRATMRIDLLRRMRAANTASEPDTETIYFIKTSKPHIQKISISGPFYPVEDAHMQLLMTLRREKSVVGEGLLHDLVHDVGLEFLKHLNAPLPDGNIMKLQLLRKKDAVVARTLPGEVWNIVVATPVVTGDRSTEHPRVKKLSLWGTFTTKEEANMAAGKVLEDLEAKAGSGAVMAKTSENGLVVGAVTVPDTDYIRLVQVTYDDCSLQLCDSSGKPT